MIKKKKLSPAKSKTAQPTKEYNQTLAILKQQIQEAQIRASLSANKELIKLYWSMGKTFVEKQKNEGWRSGVIENLANDLQNEFPGVGGFSRANIFYMRAFYIAYEKVQQAVGLFETLPIFSIPWGHNVILITKLKDNDQRLWYAQKAIEHGWSRAILEMQIESKLYNRKGKAITNFQAALPTPQSDMAHQALKDPYVFSFLTLHEEHIEQDLELGLIDHIQQSLLELGEGFSFVGRQFHLEIDEKDYYIDLLFYHIKLRCYVVVELKARAFDPRDTGQIGFYLAAVDNILKQHDEKPTIGLLLCKTKSKLTVEYALQASTKPIGVASYQTKLVAKLPKELKSNLPTIEKIEAELEKKETVRMSMTKRHKKSFLSQR